MNNNLLIVDDEQNIREGIRQYLSSLKLRVFTARNGIEALEMLQEKEYQVVVADIKMPDLDGIELLKKIKDSYPDIEVIMLTAHATIETAVEAMRLGAHDYLEKPCDPERLNKLVSRIFKTKTLEEENKALKEKLEDRVDDLLGKSSPMHQVFKMIRQIAPSKASVLITGESGTGKELVAKAIHNLSSRKDKPFIRVNCAALPETLLESELFGHERGSFTGAIKQKKGRFELADGGSILLDEVNEMDSNVQVKLLRVLQEREFERVGGTQTIRVDIRVLAATNRDIEQFVREGKFREDLYFRLKVIKIQVPPLRDRLEDIPFLTERFVQDICRENNKEPIGISPEVIRVFLSYPWPGNVRELRNVLEGMVVLAKGDSLTLNDVPFEITSAESKREIKLKMNTSLYDAEKEIIVRTLETNGGNRSQTAKVLGIGRRTLIRKLQQYGISSPADSSELE